VYDGIPYKVKQETGDLDITAENMEKSQHTDFNEDTTNESASVAVATYGCESWTIRKNEETRLDAFEMKGLRKILRVSWTAKKTNDWILNKARVGLNCSSSINICRWLDGSLLDLTAEMVESELEDYWHELFKVQKLFVTKLRKAKVDNSMSRKRSAADVQPSPELLNSSLLNSSINITLPANSENTLRLITSIQDRMKEFKASV